MLDDRVGGLDDGASGAVVLLQLIGLRCGVVVAERENILDLRTAERVDTLRIVTHDAHPTVQLREATDDDVLGEVGILILIHQDVVKQLLILAQHIGAVPEQDVGLQQQVVEVHRAVLLAAAAILHIHIAKVRYLRLTILGSIGRVGNVGCGRNKTVLGKRYAREHPCGLVLVVRQVHLLANGLDEVLAIRGLVDGVGVGKANALGILTKDAREDRVECTHAYVTCARAHHLLDAGTHLLGSLVGKGQCQNVMRLHALLQHICYARGQNSRLARTCTRNDERWLLIVFHRRPLLRVQTLKYCRFHMTKILN